MKSYVIICLFIVTIFLGCSKNEDGTIILKTSGQLKVQIVNKQNQPFENIRVKLFDYSLKDILKDSYTDKNGLIDFKDINSGNYSIIVDTPKINNVKFYPQENIQIISGINQLYKIVVDDYVGNVILYFNKISIINNIEVATPFTGLNILFINIDNYALVATLDYFKSKASMIIKTDSSGIIKADKLPSGATYEVIAYKENANNYRHIYDFDLKKGDILTKTIYLDSTTLYGILPPYYK